MGRSQKKTEELDLSDDPDLPSEGQLQDKIQGVA